MLGRRPWFPNNRSCLYRMRHNIGYLRPRESINQNFLRKVRKPGRWQAHFLKTDATPDEVGEAGLKLFVLLYGGKSSDTLSSLRFTKYLKMTSVSSALKPEKLAPERATWFHWHRVYFQVQEWNSLMESKLDPLDWGWILDGGSLTPPSGSREPLFGVNLDVIS